MLQMVWLGIAQASQTCMTSYEQFSRGLFDGLMMAL